MHYWKLKHNESIQVTYFLTPYFFSELKGAKSNISEFIHTIIILCVWEEVTSRIPTIFSTPLLQVDSNITWVHHYISFPHMGWKLIWASAVKLLMLDYKDSQIWNYPNQSNQVVGFLSVYFPYIHIILLSTEGYYTLTKYLLPGGGYPGRYIIRTFRTK